MTHATLAPSPSDRSTEFVAVQGGAETTSAGAMLVWAYMAMWAAVFLFVWWTARRQARLDGRLAELERALAEREREATQH